MTTMVFVFHLNIIETFFHKYIPNYGEIKNSQKQGKLGINENCEKNLGSKHFGQNDYPVV